MDCRQFRDLISFWLDGVLERQELELFNQHMETCEQCRRELNEYQDMISIIKNMREEPLPDGFHERLHIGLKEEINLSGESPLKGKKPIKWVRWIGAIAAILVLLVSIKALDNVGLWGNYQSQKDGDSAKFTKESAQGLDLGIASIEEASEDMAGSKKDSFQDSPQKQSNDQGEAEISERTLNDTSMSLYENTEGGSQFIQYEAKDDKTRIETDFVKLKVQDVCVTTFTLKMMALNNGIEVIKSTDESVVLQISDPKQREILYEELSRIGEVEDVGDNIDSQEITITIITEK